MASDQIDTWRRLVLALGLSLLSNFVLTSLLLYSWMTRSRPVATRVTASANPSNLSRTRAPKSSPRVLTEGLPSPVVAVLKGHQKGIRRLVYSADGSLLAVANEAGWLTLWAVRNRDYQLLSEFFPETPDRLNEKIQEMGFSPDGLELAYSVASFAGLPDIRILSVGSNRSRALLSAEPEAPLDSRVTGLAYLPDGSALVVGLRNGLVLLDPVGGQVRGVFKEAKQSYYFSSLSCSHGKPTLVAAATALGLIQVFEIDSLKKVADLKGPEKEHRSDVFIMTALSPDGRRIAGSTLGNRVLLWELPSGKLLADIQEGIGTGWTEGSCWIGFAGGGRWLLTASRGSDNLSMVFVRRRDPDTGSLVAQNELPSPGEAFPDIYPRVFSPDGRTLAVVSYGPINNRTDLGESFVAIYDVNQLVGDLAAPRP